MRVYPRFAIATCQRRAVDRWIIVLLVVALVIAASASATLAGSSVWNSNAATGSWEDTGNWNSGIVPGATSGTANADTAVFNSSSTTTAITPDLSRNLENITFDTASAPYTIGEIGGNALLLTAGGTIQIASGFSGSNVTETINAPLTLQGNYTFAANSLTAGNNLNFGGDISAGVAGIQTLTIQGDGDSRINGAIGDGTGAIALIKNGAGTLTLGSANSFTGPTTINAGKLVLGNSNALGSTAGGAAVNSGATLDLAGQTIGAKPLTIAGTGAGSFSANAALINSSTTTASLAGTINQGTGGSFSVGGTGGISLSGGILASSTLTYVGSSTLTLAGTADNAGLGVVVNGSDSFNSTVVLGKTSSATVHAVGAGGLSINSGTVQLGGTGGDQIDDAASVTVTNGGAFECNGMSEVLASLSLAGRGVNSGIIGFRIIGALVNSGAGASIITPTGGTILTADATIAVSNGSLTLNNAIRGSFGLTVIGGSSLAVPGGGALILTGNNTFSGGLNVGGTLRIATINNASTDGPLGNNTLVKMGGTVEYTGSTASCNMPFQLSSGSFAVDAPDTVLTLSGTISGAGTLIKTGPGTLTLSGNNAFSGGNYFSDGFIIYDGILRLGSAGALNANGFNSVAMGPTGTLALSGNSVTISALRTNFFVLGSPVVQNGSATPATLTIDNNAPFPSSDYGGVLRDGPGGGALSLVKNGSATQTLSGGNTYTGGTTVVNGVLSTTSSGTLGASTGPLTISAASGVTSAVSLGSNQTVGQLSGTVAAGGSATIYVAAGTTLTVNQSSQSTFAGTLANSGTVDMASSDDALLELTGAPWLFSTSALKISGGTLRFKVSSGVATIGAAVTATVADTATLELAGSVSALGSTAGNRVNVNNSSMAQTGLLVSGTHQVVGNVDGTGNTRVNDGGVLMANHIVQSALIIGGTAGSRALVTIAASDPSGNPLVQPSGFGLAESLTSDPFGAGVISCANLSNGAGVGSAALSPDNSDVGVNVSAVPEPSTLALALLTVLGLVCTQFARYHLQHPTV